MELKDINTSWDSWKRYLGQAVEFAEEIGVSKDKIKSTAQEVGQFLADQVPPATPEQKTIKELWQVANNDEKQVLTSLMMKLVDPKGITL